MVEIGLQVLLFLSVWFDIIDKCHCVVVKG